MGPIQRPYQKEATGCAVGFFNEKKNYNGVIIAPTGSGKSVIIANTAGEIGGNIGILQPSKEILEQNFRKYTSYGYRAGIYSASGGMKFRDTVTFATIGSVVNKPHVFKNVKKWIIDECHVVNPEEGMYHKFINAIDGSKVLGLTASPYRLVSTSSGSMLRFITRQSPRFFNKVLYYIQNSTLFDAGHLAPLEYYKFNVIDRSMLRVNKTGSDFTEESVKEYYRRINFPAISIEYANRILVKRSNLLVFCTLLHEAYKVCAGVPGSVVIDGDTPPDQRTKLLNQFKAGKIRCVINVGVLGIGFDFPGLEACLLAFSTMSLNKYYQNVGRLMRPFTYPDGSIKTGWVVDLGGNISKFGKIETMKIVQDHKGLYSVWNDDKQLTNVHFSAY